MEPITFTGETGKCEFVNAVVPRLLRALEAQIQAITEPAEKLYLLQRLSKKLEESSKALKESMEPGETWVTTDGQIAYQKTVATKKVWSSDAVNWAIKNELAEALAIQSSKLTKKWLKVAEDQGLYSEQPGAEVVRQIKLESEVFNAIADS